MEYIDQGLSLEIIRRLYTMQLVRCHKQRLARSACTVKAGDKSLYLQAISRKDTLSAVRG
jgi:hypothetical protein